MRKLKLVVDTLEVQTFEPLLSAAREPGTVRANAVTTEDDCYTLDGPSCECTDQYATECCGTRNPSGGVLDCDSAWLTCIPTGGGGGN